MRMSSSDPKNRSILERQELLLESAAVPPDQPGEWLRRPGIQEEHPTESKNYHRDIVQDIL